jgi:hypothetical protein
MDNFQKDNKYSINLLAVPIMLDVSVFANFPDPAGVIP